MDLPQPASHQPFAAGITDEADEDPPLESVFPTSGDVQGAPTAMGGWAPPPPGRAGRLRLPAPPAWSLQPDPASPAAPQGYPPTMPVTGAAAVVPQSRAPTPSSERLALAAFLRIVRFFLLLVDAADTIATFIATIVLLQNLSRIPEANSLFNALLVFFIGIRIACGYAFLRQLGVVFEGMQWCPDVNDSCPKRTWILLRSIVLFIVFIALTLWVQLKFKWDEWRYGDRDTEEDRKRTDLWPLMVVITWLSVFPIAVIALVAVQRGYVQGSGVATAIFALVDTIIVSLLLILKKVVKSSQRTEVAEIAGTQVGSSEGAANIVTSGNFPI